MSHTPGPWTRWGDTVYSSRARCAVVRLPALTDAYGDEPPEQIDRWDADARLIRAAPELLEQLEKLVRLVENNWLDEQWEPEEWALYDEYRDVIKKARGEG